MHIATKKFTCKVKLHPTVPIHRVQFWHNLNVSDTVMQQYNTLFPTHRKQVPVFRILININIKGIVNSPDIEEKSCHFVYF